MRSHAIANGVFVGAPNRVGVEGPMTYYGGTFVCDPFGEVIARAGGDPDIVFADLDFGRNRELRELLQFFRDRRPDTYRGLLRVSPDSGKAS
jgi:predicted amidohydrolase